MIALTSRQDAALTMLLYLGAWLVLSIAFAAGWAWLRVVHRDMVELRRHRRARAALRRAHDRVWTPEPTWFDRLEPFDHERGMR